MTAMLPVLSLADVVQPGHGSSGTAVWVIVAVVAAVVLIGLGVLYRLRSRRRSRAGKAAGDKLRD